jgi:hypothetical protein
MKNMERPKINPDQILLNYTRTVQTAKVRPEGYLEDILAHADRQGDWLVMSRAAYLQHLAKFSPQGLGDKIAQVAQPIAKAMDAILGTAIKNCGGCQNRQNAFNKAFSQAPAALPSPTPIPGPAPLPPKPGEPSAINQPLPK